VAEITKIISQDLRHTPRGQFHWLMLRVFKEMCQGSR